MPGGVVIVGSGQAGYQTAASLRSAGYAEPITLVGEEPHVPYQRPPLSKGFALGKQDRESLEFRPANFYRDHSIDLLVGEKVMAIDRAARSVLLASARRLSYGSLVLAVGARNRLLPIPGATLDGVVYLRSLDEATAFNERLQHAQNIVVVGGGFIGLELAAVAGALGKSVTVLEALPRLMSRVVAPSISEFFRELHAGHGVKIVCGCSVVEIAGVNAKAHEVKLADGTAYPADLVIVGIGVVPNVGLARDAALPVANGVAVDEFLRTADENIYAIGDCAEHPCHFTRARVRLESVQNAADQAQHVAATIAGHSGRYEALPWFWTDQFDTKLQIAGISQGHDRAEIRGNAATGKFSVFYYREGCLIAVDSVNRPMDHMLSRKLISANAPLTPEQVADESFDLRQFAAKLPRR